MAYLGANKFAFPALRLHFLLHIMYSAVIFEKPLPVRDVLFTVFTKHESESACNASFTEA